MLKARGLERSSLRLKSKLLALGAPDAFGRRRSGSTSEATSNRQKSDRRSPDRGTTNRRLSELG